MRDQAAFLPLPAVPYDACHKQPSRVSSLSLVRYKTNDYSVPTAYGHHSLLIKGYVERVDICCGTELIARHRRSYERADFIYDPLHYLALLERKPGALDQAAPLEQWSLPECFGHLRRQLEAHIGKQGRREFIQVLRLLETFELSRVAQAIGSAIDMGAIGFDAVKHLLLCQIEHRPAKLDLALYPYLPRAEVGRTDPRAYLHLLSSPALAGSPA